MGSWASAGNSQCQLALVQNDSSAAFLYTSGYQWLSTKHCIMAPEKRTALPPTSDRRCPQGPLLLSSQPTAMQLGAQSSVHSWLPRCPLTACSAESSASLSALLPPRPGPVLLPFSLLCLRGIQRILLLPDKRSSAKPKCTTVRGVTSQMMRHYGRAENGFT